MPFFAVRSQCTFTVSFFDLFRGLTTIATAIIGCNPLLLLVMWSVRESVATCTCARWSGRTPRRHRRRSMWVQGNRNHHDMCQFQQKSLLGKTRLLHCVMVVFQECPVSWAPVAQVQRAPHSLQEAMRWSAPCSRFATESMICTQCSRGMFSFAICTNSFCVGEKSQTCANR